jgi:hypothetical protein
LSILLCLKQHHRCRCCCWGALLLSVKQVDQLLLLHLIPLALLRAGKHPLLLL